MNASYFTRAPTFALMVGWCFFILFLSFSSNPVNAQALQQCQIELEEYRDITQIAREQIAALQLSASQKDELIAQHKVKIELLQKRIALLQSSDEVSADMISLLEQNQEICLATEQQAYDLMQKVMTDYKAAVDKATRPWYLDPSFYGGLLIGALIML